MNTMSSLAQPSAGVSGALLEDAGRTALDSTQPEMTISQMSRLFGVSLRTLRFYEDRGLIKPRREGNARYYRATDRIRMEMILKGKKLGFTLTEIQDLIGAKGTTETADLEDQLNPQQIVTQISHLERQRSEIEGAIERLRATQSRLAQVAAA
jgi:DNA-binding transcriptional MerR regulator